MYLELTPDEQDLLAGTRRHLTTTNCAQLLRDREHEPWVVDRAWWRTGSALGWTAPLVPEPLGGGSVTGTPLRELGLVAYEQGRVAGPGPLAGMNAALSGLVRAAEHGWQSNGLLADVVDGKKTVSWAAGDGGAWWRPWNSPITLERETDGYIVSGMCAQAEVGVEPDLILLTATAGTTPVQLLISTNAPGVTLEPLLSLDLARRFARVVLERVHVPASAVVSEGAEAVAQVDRQFLIASALLAADTCGALTAGFAMTMEWMNTRFTFGRPLASYQALKHRIADIRTHLEVAYAVTTAALDGMDADEGAAAELVSVAQAYVGEHAPLIFSEFIQLHGGIGVTWEHDLHIYLRRVMANSAIYGTPADHHRLLADIVVKGA